MDDVFEETPAAVSGRIPDGEYEGVIERFDFWEPDGGGPLKLITEISVDTGDYAGRSAPSIWNELEDPDRLKYTKGFLELLGIEGIKLSELEEALEPLAGRCRVEFAVVSNVSKKNGKTYTNTYIRQVLGMDGESKLERSDVPADDSDFGEVGDFAPGSLTEDDIPF
jgi:hypothetical protein